MAQDLIHLISWIMAGQPTPPWRLPLRNNGSRRPYQGKPMINKPLIMGRGVTGLVIHRACPDSSQRNVDLTWLYSIRPRHLFLLKLDGVILSSWSLTEPPLLILLEWILPSTWTRICTILFVSIIVSTVCHFQCQVPAFSKATPCLTWPVLAATL